MRSKSGFSRRPRPGTRAPYQLLERDGQRLPVHDVFGTSFVLLTGSEGVPWLTAVEQVASATGIPIAGYRIGPNSDLVDIESAWPERYGVSRAGAVLIRPDGYVAWRRRKANSQPRSVLVDVLARLEMRVNDTTGAG
jgi:putative polyketide hydroxylase